jgi:GGDEF domain-containing protein
LGRIGGEEFVVLLPETDEIAAESAAERLRGSFEQAKASLPARTSK